MKKLLIAINCVLAFLLVLNLWGAFRSHTAPPTVVAAKKKKSSKNLPPPVTAPLENKSVLQLPEAKSAAETVVRKNIFEARKAA